MDDVDDLFNQLQAQSGGDELRPAVEVISAPSAQPQPLEEPTIDVRKHVARHEAILDEILASCRADRQEVQTAVNYLKQMIDTNVAAGQRPSGSMLECYVRALEVKGNVNATAVRLLDSTAKLLVSTRPSHQVNNSLNITGNNPDLLVALSRPSQPSEP